MAKKYYMIFDGEKIEISKERAEQIKRLQFQIAKRENKSKPSFANRFKVKEETNELQKPYI